MADKVLQPAEVSSLLHEVKQEALPPSSEDYVVSGTALYNGWFLKAKRIVFKSGAKLVFSLQAQDKRNLFWIVAEEIVCEDGQAPGLISSRYMGANENFVPVVSDQAAILRPTARRIASRLSQMH